MSRLLGFIIVFFLGEFGIHRFLAGKIGTGIIWLCTGGLFGIGWIYDIIMVALGKFKKKNGEVWAK